MIYDEHVANIAPADHFYRAVLGMGLELFCRVGAEAQVSSYLYLGCYELDDATLEACAVPDVDLGDVLSACTFKPWAPVAGRYYVRYVDLPVVVKSKE